MDGNYKLMKLIRQLLLMNSTHEEMSVVNETDFCYQEGEWHENKQFDHMSIAKVFQMVL